MGLPSVANCTGERAAAHVADSPEVPGSGRLD